MQYIPLSSRYEYREERHLNLGHSVVPMRRMSAARIYFAIYNGFLCVAHFVPACVSGLRIEPIRCADPLRIPCSNAGRQACTAECRQVTVRERRLSRDTVHGWLASVRVCGVSRARTGRCAQGLSCLSGHENTTMRTELSINTATAVDDY